MSTLPQVSIHPLGHTHSNKHPPPPPAYYFLKWLGIQKRNVTNVHIIDEDDVIIYIL